MPEADNSKQEKNYYFDIPQKNENYLLKGSNSYDWGMKNRLARIFNPDSGRTVMLAFDHGYFQGPTTGLERIDVTIKPLEPYADALMLTRGVLRSLITPCTQKGIVVRGGSMAGLAEEAPAAYKDVDRVVNVVHSTGVARKVARLVPLGVIKG